MPVELADALNRYPWLLLIVVALAFVRYAGQLLAEASESWAKILGPLGRRWRANGQRRRERVAADLLDMQRQVDWLSERLEAVEEDAQMRIEYIAYDAEWHVRDRLHGIAQGWERMPPPHQSFLQFRQSHATSEPS